LFRVQENRPLLPRKIESTGQFLDIRHDSESPLSVGMVKRVDLLNLGNWNARFPSGRQFKESLSCLRWQTFCEGQMAVLVDLADIIDPLRRNPIGKQLVVGFEPR